MIDIGSIDYGSIPKRRQALRELERLSQDLRAAPVPEPRIELAFIIPGRFGKADFSGFQTTRRRGGNRDLIVFIEVPESVTLAADPLPALANLASSAIRYATDPARPKGQRISPSDGDALLAELNGSMGRLGVTPAPGIVEATPASSRAAQLEPEAEAGVEVVLATPDRTAIDEAFALEERLADQLSSLVGYVDGNEVGQGEYSIFVYGPALAPLRDSVVTCLQKHWRRPGAAVRLLDPTGDEVEKLRL